MRSFLLTVGLAAASLAAAEPDTLQAASGLESGKEKGFYQELMLLSRRHDKELQQYRRETRELEPAERLRRRRLLMVAQRRELAALEAKWGDQASDQHHRWLQRQEDRRRRLEALRRKAERPRETRTDTVRKDSLLPRSPAR